MIFARKQTFCETSHKVVHNKKLPVMPFSAASCLWNLKVVQNENKSRPLKHTNWVNNRSVPQEAQTSTASLMLMHLFIILRGSNALILLCNHHRESANHLINLYLTRNIPVMWNLLMYVWMKEEHRREGWRKRMQGHNLITSLGYI